MKNFKLIHETPDHFVLHNGKAHFHVAKSGITGETAQKIRALAQGGTPDDTPPGAITPDDTTTADASYDPKKDSTNMSGYPKKDENEYLPTPSWVTPHHYAEGGETVDRKPATAEQQTPNPDVYQPTPLPQDEKSTKPKKIQVNMDEGDFDSIPGFAKGGKLDANARSHIAPHNFALPNGRYPIENASHARNALARVSGNGTPDEKAEVRAKVHAKYPGIQMKSEGGAIQYYSDGTDDAQPAQPASTPPPDNSFSPTTQAALNNISNAFGSPHGNPDNKAMGGEITNPAKVHSTANESQSEAIRRYADGNPATLSKGGHVHHNAGKNQLHFHFYDGASIPSPLDQYEGNVPNPGPAPTALDNYADGGDVQPSDSDKLASAIGDTARGLANQDSMIAGAQADQDASPQTSGATPNVPSSPSATTANTAPAVIPPEQQIPAAPKASAPTPDQQPSMLSDFDKNIALEQQGIQQGAAAQSAGYKATAQAIGQNQLQQKAMMDAYQLHSDQLTKQNEELFKGVADSTVDPTRFWHNKSTPGKVASIIGVLLGGIGEGLSPTHTNLALQSLQRAQQLDIQQQQSDQSNKMNLYKMGLERYHDQQAAGQFAMLQSNALLQGTLQKIAAQTGAPQATATAQQMIGQIGIQNANLRSELSLRQAAMGAMNGPQTQAGVDPQKLRLLTMAGIIPKDEAPMAQKEYGDYQQLSNVLDHTDQVYKTLNNTANYRERISQSIPFGSHIPTVTDASKQYQAVANDFLGNITKDTEGRVTPTDVELMRPSLPQPGDSPQVAATKINNIKDQIREKYKFPTLQSYNLLHQGDPVATSAATRAKKFTERPPR